MWIAPNFNILSTLIPICNYPSTIAWGSFPSRLMLQYLVSQMPHWKSKLVSAIREDDEGLHFDVPWVQNELPLTTYENSVWLQKVRNIIFCFGYIPVISSTTTKPLRGFQVHSHCAERVQDSASWSWLMANDIAWLSWDGVIFTRTHQLLNCDPIPLFAQHNASIWGLCFSLHVLGVQSATSKR